MNTISLTEIYVRYYETDKMGIVHHSNYFRYFELSRCDFFSKYIVPYSILEEKYRIQSPLLSASANFYKPLKFENILTIITFVKSFTITRLKFYYIAILCKRENIKTKELEIGKLRKSNNIICEGETEHTFVNVENFKPVRPRIFIEEKGDYLDKILYAAVAQLDQSM